MQEAKDIAQRFEYIKTEVKAFPSKVQAATTKQSCTKFWNQLCDAIKGCYLWIVKVCHFLESKDRRV